MREGVEARVRTVLGARHAAGQWAAISTARLVELLEGLPVKRGPGVTTQRATYQAVLSLAKSNPPYVRRGLPEHKVVRGKLITVLPWEWLPWPSEEGDGHHAIPDNDTRDRTRLCA